MDVPVPETNKDAERVTLPRVASPSSSNFEKKVVIVTPKLHLSRREQSR